MVKYYVDTCIWRDYWENRTDNLRPLGEFAARFFSMAVENEDIVLVSDLVIKELRTVYTDDLIKEIFSVIPKKLFFVVIGHRKDLGKAEKFSIKNKIHFMDAVHIVLAQENGAKLISRDNHMLEAGHALKPEDL